MHTRKIQLVAGTTYSVSLPKEWVKKNKLREKDEVVFHENSDRSLLLFPHAFEKKDVNEIYLNIDEYIPIIGQVLFAIYYRGIENMVLFSKKNLTKEVRLKIREVLAYMSGTEITYEDKEKIIIKVLLDKSKVEITQVFYRIYLLIDSSAAILAGELNTREIEINEIEIDRLYHLLTKIVSVSLTDSDVLYSSKIRDVSLVPAYFLISKKLENLADNISHLSKYLYKNKVDFEGSENLKLILPELSRSIKHICGGGCKIFASINNEDTRKIYEQIHEVKDQRIRKYLEEMARYTLDIEDEVVNISFYNKMRHKLDRSGLQNAGDKRSLRSEVE